MDEIVVRVARAIDCVARLRILSYLARGQESAPTTIARELRMAKNVVSTHLRVLSSAGLTQRRRSVVWCYSMSESPYGEKTLSGQITVWLRGMPRAPARTLRNQDCGVRELRNLDSDQMEARLRAIVFEAATAFTNVRRIQILLRLTRGEAVTVRTLTKELSMSEPAVGRHTDVLASELCGLETAATVSL